MQPTASDSALDRISRKPELEKLPAGNHPMLELDQVPDRVSSGLPPHLGG
jgi:hypothetical protein